MYVNLCKPYMYKLHIYMYVYAIYIYIFIYVYVHIIDVVDIYIYDEYTFVICFTVHTHSIAYIRTVLRTWKVWYSSRVKTCKVFCIPARSVSYD